MSLWSVSSGSAIVWSYYQNKLYIAPSTSGQGHDLLHLANNLPRVGPAFDAIERGRALFTKSYKVIEVVSPGRNEWISNRAIYAVLKHFGATDQDDVVILHPGWSKEDNG